MVDPARAAKPAPSDSDEGLIRQHIGGDHRAFGHLVERYRHRVVTLVRCRLGGQSLWVEDVAQDVFLQVHRQARRFEGRSTFKTWLFAVALNVCRDHIRRERRHAGTRPAEADDEHALARLPSESLDPLELLTRSERDALIRRAIERLTATQRTILQLRDWEDLTYDEIAHVLSVPVGTVRSRLHNARAALAQALVGGMNRSCGGLP